MRQFLYGVQDPCAGVVSLFLMLLRLEQSVNVFGQVRTEYGSLPPIVVAILGVDFFVVKMFRLHVAFLRDIPGELLISPFVFAK